MILLAWVCMGTMLKEFIKRFREGQLIEKDHERLGLILWSRYTLISLLITGGVVETEISDYSDNVIYIALVVFSLPWFIAVRFVQRRTNERLLKSIVAIKVLRFFAAVLFFSMAAYGGIGYVSLVNALTGSTTPDYG